VVVEQDEVFLGVVVAPFGVDVTGHTEEERLTMTEHRWWARDDLATTKETIWPAVVLDLWHLLESGGEAVDLGQQEESTVPVEGP
jgi:hypothetical protein